MAELLLELLSEEIPARMQARAADDLKRLVTEELKKAGLEFTRADAYVTPRRLALVVDGLPTETPDISEERRGPRADAPDKAVEGFLRANGISKDQADIRDTGKGEFYFAVIEKKGQKTAELLAECLPAAVGALPWPKSMRWADHPGRWVRPLHSVLCILDGAVVGFEVGPVASGATTLGHRFLAPGEVTAKDFADYRAKLEDAFVLLDPAARRAKIEADAAALAKEAGLVLKDDPGLLDEVVGLVEWPVVLMGTIDDQFMDIPPEVLTTAMRSHQKYFALETQAEELAPRFIVVANRTTADGGKAVVAGNERVLRARLSDAKFFWDQDRKEKLESRVPALDGITFHAKLGSLGAKVDRIEALAVELAAHIEHADKDRVRSAARLAKADLTSQMVYEFPELQGIMGRYYALHDGEHADVAHAIADHYAPQGPGDACPTAPVSIAVALADKIDTLVGFWAIDEKPTGSKDPYALRRAALGVIRLILENKLSFSVRGLIEEAWKISKFEGDRGSVVEDLRVFFFDRLKVHLRETGIRHDLVDALFAKGGEDDLLRIVEKAELLKNFLATDDGANLLTAYRRANNILQIEMKKDRKDYLGGVNTDLIQSLGQPEEKALLKALEESGIRPNSDGMADFEDAVKKLAKLRKPVDDYFDQVTVNSEDPKLRENRLRQLSEIVMSMDMIADFSQIEGGER